MYRIAGKGKTAVKKSACITLAALLATLLAAAVLTAGGCGKQKVETPASSPREAAAWMNSLPVQKAAVGDVELAYRDVGAGEPLLLIMGFSGTMDNWDPIFLQALSRKYRVITFDYRGVGASDAGSEPFTIPLYASDAAGLLDALGISRANVLGWSMGTNVAQEMVLAYPDKVDHLVLYAADAGGDTAILPSPEVIAGLSNVSGSLQDRADSLLKLLAPPAWMAEHGDYFNQIFSESMEIASPVAIMQQVQAMIAWQGCYDRLPLIASDTLLVTGTEDVITPSGNSLLMVEKIPNAWLVQLKVGGHGAMYQYPEKLAAIVGDFLDAP